MSASNLTRMTRAAMVSLCLLLLVAPVSTQDLDPRAYANVPVNATFLVSGFSLSSGEALTDPTLPVTGVHATVLTPSIGVARSFSLFGRTAQAFGALPYAWAEVSGNVFGQAADTTLAGLSDMHARLSVLVRGAPAASVQEILKAPRRTILGTSLTVVAPTGRYFSNRLINVGTNRWTFKPEFAVSRPIGQAWLVDTYAGLWLFTANNAFYPGALVRTEAPIAAFQAHVSYTFRRQAWVAFDATYYVGGRMTIQGVENEDRQSNSRVGATLVLPVGRRHSVKFAVSRSAIIRYGADFSTVSFGWQTAWVPQSTPSR